MKKSISVLLALIIALSSLPFQALAAAGLPETPPIPATPSVTVRLEEAYDPEEAGIVTVSAFVIGQNPGFNRLQVRFDSEGVLRLARAENGTLFPNFDENSLTFSAASGKDITAVGLLGTFTFAVESGNSLEEITLKMEAVSLNAAGTSVKCDNASLRIRLGNQVAIRLEAEPTTVDRGGDFTVRALITENAVGFNKMTVEFEAGEVLSPFPVDNGTVAPHFDAGTLTFSADPGVDIKDTGLLGTFTFSVGPEFPAGEIPLRMRVLSLENAAGERLKCDSADLTVMVTNRPTEIRFRENYGEVSTAEGENTLSIHADVWPENADTNDLIWTCDNESVAQVKGSGADAVITGISAGEATVTVSLLGNPGISAWFTVAVNCAHEFVQLISPLYLKSEGTCRNPAIYWESCRFCGSSHPSNVFSGPAETLNPENHEGGTYQVGEVPASCTREGYSGNTVCSGCNEVISYGDAEPMLDHAPASDWMAGAEKHYIPCVMCGLPLEEEDHRGGAADCAHKALCDVCGGAYGELNPDIHNGGTRLDGRREATCAQTGYTGDTVCSGCNAVLSFGKEEPMVDHTYDNDCDTTCNICGETRQVKDHVYDNDCDTTCNICGETRTVPDHVYDNDCDTTCNICGAIRSVKDHVYDNDCDDTCNICGARRVPPHHYDESGFCTECGAECPKIKWGDADGNGDVNLADALLVLQYVAAGGQGVEVEPGANADGVGEITLADALLILQYVAAGGQGVVLGPQG